MHNDDVQMLVAFGAVLLFAFSAAAYIVWEEWKRAVRIDENENNWWIQ